MTVILANNWWVVALRGLLAVLFGVLTWVWPGLTINALVLLFGAYALLDGIFNLVSIWRMPPGERRWGSLLLEGIAGIATGVITFFWPGITTLALLYLIAAWAIVTGALEVVAAIRLRRYIPNEWLLILSGAASLLLGILLVLAPVAGALVIAVWIGAYAFVFGCLLIGLAFRLRRLNLSLSQQDTRTAA